ncbi:hypothetical protein [Nocardia nepalensis]|uniref:hypothetical protein n=1 Tax=Nocardia nepalensis TaxID=3375448 RepID=UPI003B679588
MKEAPLQYSPDLSFFDCGAIDSIRSTFRHKSPSDALITSLTAMSDSLTTSIFIRLGGAFE